MLGQWNGGTGNVLGEMAMEAQEERAASVGLWASRGVPRPLRANTGLRPVERLGWVRDGEDPVAVPRRGTVFYESEEWPETSEGGADG